MVFAHIEKLKQQYTDKYVVVDNNRPELARFGGRTGQVRTVNMSGRALVEFEGDLNVGWYDIEVDFLKVVDKPAPKEKSAPKAKAKKAPAKKAPSKLEKARASSGKKSAGTMSVADMLAAARGNKSATTDSKPAKNAKSMPVADVLAAARKPSGGSAPAAKLDPKSMSVADMLAAARSNKAPSDAADSETPAVVAVMESARRPSENATPAPAGKKADPKSMSVADMLAAARGEKSGPPSPEPVEDAVETETAVPAVVAASDGPLPTETADMIAYCRRQDAE